LQKEKHHINANKLVEVEKTSY